VNFIQEFPMLLEKFAFGWLIYCGVVTQCGRQFTSGDECGIGGGGGEMLLILETATPKDAM
jgi:hypothetical protein